MPPKAADQKRKRGRPSNASKTDSTPTNLLEAEEAESRETEIIAEEVTRPSRRGRPKRKEAEPSPPAEEPSVDEPKARRRGRPRREEQNVEDTAEVSEGTSPKENTGKAKRSNKNDEERAAEQEEEPSQASPRRRGRKPAKEAHKEAPVADEPGTSSANKRRRGRPAKLANADEQPEVAEVEPPPKKKRGRPSLNKAPTVEEPTEDVEEEVAPKKRGRKPKEKSAEIEEPAPEEDAEVRPTPRKRRGRPAKTAADTEEAGPEKETDPPKRKRGRPSNQPEPESPNVSKDEMKRGRRRGEKQPSPAEGTSAEKPTEKRRKKSSRGEEEPSPAAHKRRPGRPRASDATSSPKDSENKSRASKKRPSENDAPTPAKKRRRRTSDEAPPGPAASRPAARYRHIAPSLRQISHSTIDEKWTPLAQPSLAIVSNLLRLAERPVLQRMSGNDKRQDQASSAIRLVTNRLNKKLARGLPFPLASAPARTGSKKEDQDGGRVEELDFERVIEGVAALERQLDPLLHAVKLLQAEKEREEKALEADYDSLETLETNARSEAKNFRDNLRKTHVLVPERKRGDDDTVKPEVEHDLKFARDESDLEDDELRGLAGQVGNHMESMRNNLKQVDGVIPQIVRTRAALQDVLFKHLDQHSYENALFG
ncbi:hypothetical protein CCHL11_03772 [Colletotrichum chlorophyti]|uniref:Kinetochore protein fta7 n=1 Tax=Colletotrichum chlorophyti TaxID=708187 RepID=A0A1Q8RQP9_9PEZI|nr:hypothetical protein CCHL11_03772 [Colletotrichum chlorophyti]